MSKKKDCDTNWRKERMSHIVNRNDERSPLAKSVDHDRGCAALRPGYRHCRRGFHFQCLIPYPPRVVKKSVSLITRKIGFGDPNQKGYRATGKRAAGLE